METIAKIVGWVQLRLLKGGTTLTTSKSKALFLSGVGAGALSADNYAKLERMRLTVAERGVNMVGLLLGRDRHRKNFATGVVIRYVVELMRLLLVEMEDVQVSFRYYACQHQPC